MTPDQLAALQAIAAILSVIGTWKIGTLIAAVILLPSVLLGFAVIAGERKYKNNVILVKNYESMAKDMREMLIMNTTVLTEVKQTADHNLFCPINRDRIKQREVKEITR